MENAVFHSHSCEITSTFILPYSNNSSAVLFHLKI